MTSKNPNNPNDLDITSGRKSLVGAEPIQARKPEDYIMEANLKAQSRSAFVGPMAERLFQAIWKHLDLAEREDMTALSRDMDACFEVADMFRLKINSYQDEQAEAVHNAATVKAAKSNLVLPTWGQVQDSIPGAHGMFGGN